MTFITKDNIYKILCTAPQCEGIFLSLRNRQNILRETNVDCLSVDRISVGIIRSS